MTTRALQIGILAPETPQAYAVKTVVSEMGFKVVHCAGELPRLLPSSAQVPADGWIVVRHRDGYTPILAGADPGRGQVMYLDAAVAPTLLNHRFPAWKRVLQKQLSAFRQHLDVVLRPQPATRVWVLAASTGGLDAVGDFLAATDPVPGVALAYVQHIANRHLDQVLAMVRKRSAWRAVEAREGSVFNQGCVTVISPAAKVHIGQEGRVRLLQYPWSGQYSPSIDDIAGQVAREFRDNAGLIVFTGMGNDGIVGSRMIRHRGGQVWVQAPADCAAKAMPEAVLGAQAVDFVGPVSALAERFNEEIAGRDNRRLAGEVL